MPRLVDSRSVLAVRNLGESTRFYTEVLGFRRDPIEAEGWSFLSRDGFKVMLGECRDAMPAGDLGDHSYFVHLLVEGLDALHEEVRSRGAEVIMPPADKPWGLREFGIRTPDGHRIMFGEPSPERPGRESRCGMDESAFRRRGHLARLLDGLVELAGIEPATS